LGVETGGRDVGQRGGQNGRGAERSGDFVLCRLG
jgi:hypothetical protein